MRCRLFVFLALLPCVVLGKTNFLNPTRSLQEGSIKLLINEDDPFLGVKYHSGYLPVGPKGSEMFYWYFPYTAKERTPDTPFMIWLTGGPGCSSMSAAVTENGPVLVKTDGTIVRNEFSWDHLGDLVFIDQPLGTGFSNLVGEEAILGSEAGVFLDAREFLAKFIEKYPYLKDQPFYITGESYAGHYIPPLASVLVESPVPGLNLKGVAIGNGWVDWQRQYPAYADFSFANNLINADKYQAAQSDLKTCLKEIAEKKTEAHTHCWDNYVSPMLNGLNSYDIRLPCIGANCYDTTAEQEFMDHPAVQKAFGINKKWTYCDGPLFNKFEQDQVISTTPYIGDLLRANLHVLIYSGDKDFICNWVGGERWTREVEWEKRKEFSNKKFTSWSVDGVPAGELRRVDNFSFLRVYDAGHMVPMDKPKESLEMLRQFFENAM